MKIQRIKIKHFKGIRSVDLIADPNCNEIAGPNEAGKSSLLDSITAAFGGKRAIDPRPITDGQAKGEIKIETDELTITRKFREGSSPPPIIITKDGKKKGQKDLDVLVSDFTFDPQKFARMKPAEQVEVIQALAGNEFIAGLKEIDERLDEAVAERTLVNRAIKRFGQIAIVEKVEPVAVAAISEELRKAEEFNRLQDQRANDVIDKAKEVDRLKQELLDAKGKLKSKEALAELYAAKGVTPDKTVIVYCATSVRAGIEFMALYSILDFPNVKLYDSAYTEWQTTSSNKVIM